MVKSCYGCNESHKKANCINDGKYCPILPDKGMFKQDDPGFIQEENGGKPKVKDIIIESLRE